LDSPLGCIMNGIRFCFFCVFVIFFSSPQVLASQLTEQLDHLNFLGGKKNHVKCIELCRAYIAEKPNDFDVNWRLSRAYQRLGREAKLMLEDNWKEVAIKNATLAMSYAEKAIELRPEEAVGYLQYAGSIGVYSDAVNIFTKIEKGFGPKVEVCLEKVYKVDKTVEYGSKS